MSLSEYAFSRRAFASVEGDPRLGGDLLFDLLQAGLAVRPFPHGQQVSALRIEQEQQAIEQRECRLVDVREFLGGGLALEVRAAHAGRPGILRPGAGRS